MEGSGRFNELERRLRLESLASRSLGQSDDPFRDRGRDRCRLSGRRLRSDQCRVGDQRERALH
ncbi:MAG: hypothetical protein MSC30_12655 [Gaiellaceae bacterium MAG52_C11]|nr:hypothetical protein [Candidatus Gaiellasilicea maunaloa]